MRIVGALAWCAMLALGGCTDPTAPETLAGKRVTLTQNERHIVTMDDEFSAINERARQFAGLHVEERALVVSHIELLPDSSTLVNAITAVTGHAYFLDDAGRRRTVRFRQVPFTFATLASWKALITSSGFLRSVTSLDVDEFRNRVSVGVRDHGTTIRLADFLSASDVPVAGVEILIRAAPIPDAVFLDDYFRPLRGGFKIENWDGGGCSIGFVVQTEIGKGLMTASHCTWRFGDSGDATDFHQAEYPTDPHVGFESADEIVVSCSESSAGCRYADAAFIIFNYDTTIGDLGYIARTIHPNGTYRRLVDGNDPQFELSQPPISFPAVNSTVYMMGQKTGWVSGTIVATCVDNPFTVLSEGVFKTFGMRCQHRASYPAQIGDSGGPVFSWDGTSSTVVLRGIHSAHLEDETAGVFSTWRFILLGFSDRLGGLHVTPP